MSCNCSLSYRGFMSWAMHACIKRPYRMQTRDAARRHNRLQFSANCILPSLLSKLLTGFLSGVKRGKLRKRSAFPILCELHNHATLDRATNPDGFVHCFEAVPPASEMEPAKGKIWKLDA